MRYTLKSGILYLEPAHEALAKIKSALTGPVKRILRKDDALVLKADVRCPDASRQYSGDARDREYVLLNGGGDIVASARPDYAEGETSDAAMRSIYRMPRVDHACLTIGDAAYVLTMHNSQRYTMADAQGRELLRVAHKGLAGGWQLEDEGGFSPEMLCGLFIFCRYIEQENEMLVV